MNITTVGVTVLVTGQAFDVGSDIKEVGVRVDGGRFEPAKADEEKGWMLWSASVPVKDLKTGDHEVVARAIDNANHTKRETVNLSVQVYCTFGKNMNKTHKINVKWEYGIRIQWGTRIL